MINPLFDTTKSVLWQFHNTEYHTAIDNTNNSIQKSNNVNNRNIKYINRIPTHEIFFEFSKFVVMTLDNVTIKTNGIVYYQIINAKAAVYNIKNLPIAIGNIYIFIYLITFRYTLIIFGCIIFLIQ